jgi:hypothetical protein
LKLQKYLNLAKLINENNFLISKKKKYIETRYVIVSYREKSRKIGDRWAEAQREYEEQEGSLSNHAESITEEAHVNSKDTVNEEHYKELAQTVQEIKAMVEAMAKKH